MDTAAFLSHSRDDLIGLILSQGQEIAALSARIADLQARLAAPPNTPDNSSLPPSKDQKRNLHARGKN